MQEEFKSGIPPMAVSPLEPDEVKEIQQRWTTYLGKDVVETNSIGMKMVLIPPGEFTMGTTRAEMDEMIKSYIHDLKDRETLSWFKGNSKKEMPAHRVKITKPFYLGATEVTVGHFRKFVEATGYKTDVERPSTLGGREGKGGFAFLPDGGPELDGAVAKPGWGGWARKPGFNWRNVGYEQPADQAVFNVSWDDATAFCRWLSDQEGREYRLPTEAEWEYACRAGTTTTWYFGNDASKFGDYGWYYLNSGNKPHAVGKKRPNAFGLYDMHGNLFEWCADWINDDYYKKSPVENPKGPPFSPGKVHALRGGAFDGYALHDRSAFRVQAAPDIGFHHIGFRVAQSCD